MKTLSLLTLGLLALPISACKDKTDAGDHSHADHDHSELLDTIEAQQDALDAQAAELAALQDAVSGLTEAVAEVAEDVTATGSAVAEHAASSPTTSRRRASENA